MFLGAIATNATFLHVGLEGRHRLLHLGGDVLRRLLDLAEMVVAVAVEQADARSACDGFERELRLAEIGPLVGLERGAQLIACRRERAHERALVVPHRRAGRIAELVQALRIVGGLETCERAESARGGELLPHSLRRGLDLDHGLEVDERGLQVARDPMRATRERMISDSASSLAHPDFELADQQRARVGIRAKLPARGSREFRQHDADVVLPGFEEHAP